MKKNDPAAESLLQSADSVATHKYEVTDYKSDSELSRGLAETHEQLSDVYTAGTSNGIVERENGKTLHIPDEGYENDSQPRSAQKQNS